MLFTEANLKNFRPSKNNNFYDMVHKKTYNYHYACIECGYPHLNMKRHALYCNNRCQSKSKPYKERSSVRMKGEKHPFYGKTLSNSHKQNIKNNHADFSREKNPNWQGGISCEPYCTQWTDKEYKNWLKYERDAGRCQNPQCSRNFNRIVLHHINYNKKDCRPVNLITLCNACNSKANFNREWHEAYYNMLMIKRGLK
jgi:hypothetical protein